MKKPDHKHIEVLKIVLHTCSAYLLWWALSPASLACPYGAPNIPNSGWVVIGRKSQLTFSLVHPHCLTKLHFQRRRCGSSSNKQTFSKHLFHSCHFWTLPLVIRYRILALSGTHTLHLPVGYLTPCKLRIFFSKSLYYYQHYLNQVLLHSYACQIRWYSFNLSTHNISPAARHGYLSGHVCISPLHNFVGSSQCAGLCSEEDVLWWSLVRTLPW